MKKVNCPINKVSPSDAHYFFGYYDKCPWNRTGEYVLAHRSTFIDHFPLPEDKVELGIINLKSKEFKKFAETTAWNWQQGCQMKWITWNGEESVIFNIRRGNEVVAMVYNPYNGALLTELPVSTYSISPQEDNIATLNYARLFDTRKDYGIAGLSDLFKDENAPKKDGITVFNVKTGKMKLVLSTNQLSDMSDNDISIYKQRLNHIMYNPSGTRFCFLHRYNRPDGICQSRLFTSDNEGTEVRLLFEGMISHYDWLDDETIVAWAGKRALIGSGNGSKFSPITLLKRCLKPIYYALGKPRILMQKFMKDSYFFIKDENGETNATPFGVGVLYCDGHCTVSPDKKWLLTDGYPDKNSCQPLFLYEFATGECFEVGRYKTPKKLDGELRVDLHPRFNHDGTIVLIDSAMDGSRGMYVVDVKQIVQ